jgi:hypothetical protein
MKFLRIDCCNVYVFPVVALSSAVAQQTSNKKKSGKLLEEKELWLRK